MLTVQEREWLANVNQSLSDAKVFIEKLADGTITDQERHEAVRVFYKIRADIPILAGIVQGRKP